MLSIQQKEVVRQENSLVCSNEKFVLAGVIPGECEGVISLNNVAKNLMRRIFRVKKFVARM
jgi:hypothetical protein